MPDIKIQTAEYISCPKDDQDHWLLLCVRCEFYRHRNTDFTITCGYEENEVKLQIKKQLFK